MTEDMTDLISLARLRTIALNIPCGWCDAKPGEPCKSKEGETYQIGNLPIRVHIARIAPVWVIYKIGYSHGRRAMKTEIAIKEMERGLSSEV